MIFVYPALVSKNVDWKILPATLKVIEKFFLVQIGQSFTSGSLRVKTEWDARKNKYSELMLENFKISDTDEILFNFLNEAQNPNQRITLLISKLNSTNNKILTAQEEINKQEKNLPNLVGKSLQNAQQRIRDLRRDVDNLNKNYDQISRTLTQIGASQQLVNAERRHKIERQQLAQGKERLDLDKSREEREKEKYTREKAAGEKEKYKTHAQKFDVVRAKGVSLDPSMANMDVMIHYIGGPATSDVGKSGDIKTQNITIGCQMAPAIIKNFDDFQDVLLDDYFSSKSEIIFKSIYRDLMRTSDKIIDKIYQYATGDVRSKSGDSDVKKDVILAPRGFIDASSFKRKSKTPKFYNYASAIVVFNKSDITKVEDENIFENQAQLQEMFRMGWNSFCIIDSTQEEVTFISMLDGGFIHKLTFSYIFNTLDSKDVYDNMDVLKRSASPFQRSIGSFRNLGKIIAKESTLVKSILNFMNG